MKKHVVLLLISMFVGCYTFSQQYKGQPQPRPKNCAMENSCPNNTLFHETNFRLDKLGMNLNSINLDHILLCREGYLTSMRIGVTYFSFSKIKSVGVPFDLNLMIGGGALMAELGIGASYLYVYENYKEGVGNYSDDVSYLAATGRVGLRYQKQHSIFFRAGYTPLYSVMGQKDIPIIADRKFISMFGAAVGYTF